MAMHSPPFQTGSGYTQSTILDWQWLYTIHHFRLAMVIHNPSIQVGNGYTQSSILGWQWLYTNNPFRLVMTMHNPPFQAGNGYRENPPFQAGNGYTKSTILGQSTTSSLALPADIKGISLWLSHPLIVQELCESRGGRPGLSVLTSLLVSVDVKLY